MFWGSVQCLTDMPTSADVSFAGRTDLLEHIANVELAAVVELYAMVDIYSKSADFTLKPMDIDARATTSMLDLRSQDVQGS